MTLPLGLWALAVIVVLFLRPITPIDETRYFAVAWEMWAQQSFVLPLLNGEPYSHKPPLLFWLMHLGWALFGVNDWSARLVQPAFAAGSLVLTWAIGRRLWPDPVGQAAASMAVWLLLASLYLLLFSSMTMFDMLVVFFVLLGVLGLLWVEAGRGAGWGWLFLGVAGGALAKGPFAVIFLAIITVTAPAWMRHQHAGWRPWVGWYIRAGIVGLAGGSVALVWALWAAKLGGPQYAEEVLWGQMAGRVVDAFAHKRPFWWYVPMLLVMLLPLALWGRFWQGFHPACWRGNLRRWLFFVWVVPPFLLLSLSSGKQPHYLLPLFPALALLVAYALARPSDSSPTTRATGPAVMLIGLASIALILPWFSDAYWGELLRGWNMLFLLPMPIAAAWLWRRREPHAQLRQLALANLILFVAVHLYAAPMRPTLDLSRFSQSLATIQEEGRPIAFAGKYRGEFHYHGRLQSPLVEVRGMDSVTRWCEKNPAGVMVNVIRQEPERHHLDMTRFRGGYDVAWGCDVVLAGKALWR